MSFRTLNSSDSDLSRLKLTNNSNLTAAGHRILYRRLSFAAEEVTCWDSLSLKLQLREKGVVPDTLRDAPLYFVAQRNYFAHSVPLHRMMMMGLEIHPARRGLGDLVEEHQGNNYPQSEGANLPTGRSELDYKGNSAWSGKGQEI